MALEVCVQHGNGVIDVSVPQFIDDPLVIFVSRLPTPGGWSEARHDVTNGLAIVATGRWLACKVGGRRLDYLTNLLASSCWTVVLGFNVTLRKFGKCECKCHVSLATTIPILIMKMGRGLLIIIIIVIIIDGHGFDYDYD